MNIDIVFSSILVEDKVFPENFDINNLENYIHFRNPIDLPSSLIKRECFKKVGFFDPKFPRLQDWEFFFRAVKKCKFFFINEPLVKVNHYSDGISANNRFLLDGLLLFIQKYNKDLQKKAISSLYRRAGIVSYLNFSKLDAYKFFFNSIKTYPLDIKTYIAILLGLFGENLFERIIIKK